MAKDFIGDGLKKFLLVGIGAAAVTVEKSQQIVDELVKKGEITQAAVSGDFFGSERADGLADALIGCRYDRQALRDRLAERGFDGAVYGITIDDMAATIAD